MPGDSRGESRVSALIYLLVAFLVVYVAVKTIPIYMRYYSMDDEVYHQVEMSKINGADTIKNDLIDKARELDIPIDPDNIELTYGKNDNLRIVMSWEDEADYGYGIVKDFDFTIDSADASGGEDQE